MVGRQAQLIPRYSHIPQQPPITVIPMAQPRTISTDTEPAQLIALRISAKQRRALQRAAKREQVSVSQLLRDLIDKGISA